MTVFAAPQGMAKPPEAETQHRSSSIRAKNVLIVINANVTGGCQDVARLSEFSETTFSECHCG